MSAYIADEVDTLIQQEGGPDSVNLLIGVREGHLNEVKDQVWSVGGSEIEELPFNSLTASVPRPNVVRVCKLDGVESVELDEGMEILEGN